MARVALALVIVAAMVSAGCGSSSDNSSTSSNGGGGGAASKLPQKIGPGEGKLNLIAWEGYTQPQWVKPFEQQTGCQVNAKYAGSSDEMVTLMRQGGGSQYDMVSASGDASLRLIKGGNVKPVNVNLIPSYKDFIPQLQSPPHNTIDGKHYGISLQWGTNTLIWNTKKIRSAPTSWAALYDSKYKGQDTVPSEGATGWADTWMLSSKAKHPNCAYLWMRYISEPKPQAQQAIYFGETPANTKACVIMDKLSKGSCAQYHADAPASYFDQIKFWKTPVADCGGGKTDCMDYTRWVSAWQEIKG